MPHEAEDPQIPAGNSLGRSRVRIPRGVWVLGFVSLFMDVSSELIHSLLPVFMVSVLGASMLEVGMIEGIAESTAQIVKVFSGSLSDYLGRRKLLAGIGYALGALSKPFFALASSTGWVLAARFADRVGKGIRGAPRDALVADITPQAVRGAAYGLRQALDTVGAFLGPLLGIGLMLLFSDDFRSVFWLAAIPAAISVALLILAVDEPAGERRPTESPFRWRVLAGLGRAYWLIVGTGAIFTLARFSEAFLVLRGHERGLDAAYAPLVFVVMNAVYALSAYPFGWLADKVSRDALLALGLAILFAADMILGAANGLPVIWAGVALWGLHLGCTQGLLAAMVADAVPGGLRGTAFGVFDLASGVTMFVASLLAGALWDRFGGAATFYAGGAFAAAALVLLLFPGRGGTIGRRGRRIFTEGRNAA
jgi:MFS family permease